MDEAEINTEDQNVPELAVKALTEAQRRAQASGRPMVYIRGGVLVKTAQGGTFDVIKKISRVKVGSRKKRVAP